MAVPNAADKWSHEAIAARYAARLAKMEKLKMAEILENNPGFELLREYWNEYCTNTVQLRIIVGWVEL